MPISRFSLALVASLAFLGAARAQSVDAVVRGVVTDPTGAALPGATVTLTNVDTGLTRSATADRSGSYRVPPVPAGVYDVLGRAPGFRPHARPGTALHVGTTVTIDIVFDAVAAAEAVEIVADAPVLETTKNTLSRLVVRKEIDSLPVDDRNFNGLAILAPGVTPTGLYGGVDIGGSRDFQNGYFVDGVSAEGLGLGDQRIAYAQDWIQEFQVLTSQYSPQFGRSSGGVLNVITRSGSNAMTGRAYAFFRDESWDATPAFASSKAPLDMKRLGAILGGRLVADRLFFFAGVEWFDNETSNVVNTSIFPERNGNVPATTDQKLYLAKLEYHPDGAAAYRFRYNRETRNSTGLKVGGVVAEENGLSETYYGNDLVAGWSQVVSATTFNVLRAAFSDTTSDSQCNFARNNPPGTWFGLSYPGARLGCNFDGFGRIESDELQLIEELTWTRSAHDVQAGVQVSHGGSAGDFRFVRDGLYTFRFDIPFSLANPASYPVAFTQFVGPTTWDYSRSAGGVFVQDSWRVNPKLTVNAGIRYDLDGSYTALNSLVRTDRGLNRVRLDRDNVAPRLGVAWTPFPDAGRTLVRAGAGVYYDENHGSLGRLLLTNSILVDRSITINALNPALNPFWPDVARARRFLAEALARNTVPEIDFGGTANLDRNLQVPYTIQASAGLSRDFGGGVTASVDGVYARGLDQYVIGDVNIDREAALREDNPQIVRLNPSYTFINRYGNDGRFTYRALQVQLGWVPNPRNAVRLAYTLAKNESNTNTALIGIGGGGGSTNPFDYDEDFGPTNNDVRHNLSVNGVATLPLGLQVSGILSARSALPWSVLPTEQLTQAPYFDTDPFFDRREPRNSRRGDGFFSLDLRLAKAFPIRDRWSATALVEMFNVTNETNYVGYVGTFTSTQFGRPTEALEKRRTQVGLRVDF
jgi:hypothetical protein